MHSASAQPVHRRTLKGQSAVLSESPLLEEGHVRLLRLFNGFTPTEWLLGMAAALISQPAVAALELERRGLIERVP